MSTFADASALLATGKSLIRAGRPEEAKLVLQRVLTDAPDNPHAWYAYSFAVDGVEQRINALEKAIILRPDSRRIARRLDLMMAQRDPENRNTDLDVVADAPTDQIRSNRLSRNHHRKMPRSLIVTGIVVAGTFMLLLVLSVNTLIESAQPREMPTLMTVNSTNNSTTTLAISESVNR
jgi:tetratricopeptide (TPR) repeat protein